MSAADDLAAAVRPLLPLRVEDIWVQDPTFGLVGQGWSLALLGDWTWQRAQSTIRWDDEVDDLPVRDLLGVDIIDIAPCAGATGCLELKLSDQSVIRVQSDNSSYEPWTFRHQDLRITYVGEA